LPHIIRNRVETSRRYEIRRGKGSMSIVGDVGLALGILLFAFGMVDLVTRI
jgi:hypothetical protein